MRADVVIAANRGPIGFRRGDDGATIASRGAGGLVSAMAGLVSDGGALWVCAALNEIDREVARAAPDGRLDRAGFPDAGAVVMVPIDAQILNAAYNEIANSTLWFLHHELMDALPTYDDVWRRDWTSYVDYNLRFAEAVDRAAAPDARVLVQDYHLALAPNLLRQRRPDLRIAHFTHTPWASVEVFASLPDDVGQELLTGMLGADVVGFHSPRWREAFVGCCASMLGAEPADDGVEYDGWRCAAQVYPLGVEREPLRQRASQRDVDDRRSGIAADIGDRRAVVRVDRTEPSKNIIRGLAAYRELLERHPEHRGRVVHLAVAYPSRQDIAAYRRYTEAMTDMARQINAELGTDDWAPVRMSVADDYPLSLAALSVADVLLINPIRDGMNLIVKEGVLLAEDVTVVLSTGAGAADQMADGALMIDPYDVTATADALHAALTMPAAERSRRHDLLVPAATSLSPTKWLAAQLAALESR